MGRKSGFQTNVDFFGNPLLGKPEQAKRTEPTFEDENRPGLDGAKGDRAEHQQAERAVKEDGVNLSGAKNLRCRGLSGISCNRILRAL